MPQETSWGTIHPSHRRHHHDPRRRPRPDAAAPMVAPYQAVILPIAAHKPGVLDEADESAAPQLKPPVLRVKLDDRDNVHAGWKFNEWEMKGVPVRIEVGPRDIENGVITVCRRDTLEKIQLPMEGVAQRYSRRCSTISSRIMFEKAQRLPRCTHQGCHQHGRAWRRRFRTALRKRHVVRRSRRARTGRSRRASTQRPANMPFDQTPIGDTCVCCGKPAKKVIYFAKAY